MFSTVQTSGAGSGTLEMQEPHMTDTAVRNASLERMLSERRSEMRDQVRSRIRDGRTDRSTEVRDHLEHSNTEIQEGLDFALLQLAGQTLTRIDEALVRLAAGRYGFCSECEGEIAEPRLRALPFALRCRGCEERFEQEHRDARSLQDRRGGFALFPDGARP